MDFYKFFIHFFVSGDHSKYKRMKRFMGVFFVFCIIVDTSEESPLPGSHHHRPQHFHSPKSGLLPVVKGGALFGLGLASASTIGALAASLLPLTITIGKKKRSVKENAFAASLKYFDLAMNFDTEFCLPLVFCEAASEQNENSTELQKAAINTARIG